MTWPTGRLSQLADTWPSNIDKHSVEGQMPVRLCNYTDVYKNASITGDLLFMEATATAEQIERFRVRVGDTIITKDSETADDIGVPAHVDYEAPDLVCGYHLSIVRPLPGVNSRFVYWAMESDFVRRQWTVLASGVTRVALRRNDVARVIVPTPTLAVQRRIADYLDRETDQIDTLIAKQEQLITTLRERRASLISQLSLSGFNPLADDRQPGPALGTVFTVTLGKMLDAKKEPKGDDVRLPYVRAANIQDNGLDLDDVNHMWYSPAEVARLDIRVGDLLVVEGGAVGTAVLIEQSMPGWSFQKTVNRVRSVSGWSTAWLRYVLRAYRDEGIIDLICDGSTIAHLTAEKLRALRIPSVEIQEQKRIVRELDEATARIDTLIAKAGRFIELSKERRAALITAAVTGQLEVPA